MEKKTDSSMRSVAAYASALKNGEDPEVMFARMIVSTSELPLRKIDFLEREVRWTFNRAYRDAELTSKLFSKAKPEKPSPWICLCSSSGFERENALKVLSGAAPNPLFFSFAIRRLNDWVAAVRSAARAKLIEIAEQSDPNFVAQSLCEALVNWSSWGRLGQDEKNVVYSLISSSAISAEIKRIIVQSSSGPMTSVLSQIGRIDVLDSYLMDIALQAIQPAVRAKAFRSIFENKMVWFETRVWIWTDKPYGLGRFIPSFSERRLTANILAPETYEMALRDSSSIVRRVAGEMVIRDLAALGKDAFRLATILANDKSDTVAYRGNFALKRLQAAEPGENT